MSPKKAQVSAQIGDRNQRWKCVLVCSAIAALLIVGGLGLYSRVIQSGLMADARETAIALHNALDAFCADYDIMPPTIDTVKGKDCDTDTSETKDLILVLKGYGNYSTKSHDYLKGFKDAKLHDGEYLNGIVEKRGQFAVLDPWGRPYFVRMDGDLNGFVADPNPTNPGGRIAKKALVWSAGKDGDRQTWKDNIGSWAER